ncbi:uncharacterized protein MELLADRAFT_109275 [Melampsora larici-populina 98AG31]|uniref:Uncharacterized protein n=1 Tax=Melampsora larici-populina (strain 98AG31 / pathotype 3-4-7) TaxID=747676 RepID=F4RVY4_MELLP|nr:uncharacterized protein MELLADRAFT_109275 [Melampsora larici-populina 98AG31]EGG03440.1 hypothetical protein MELLADRAFT_109275 [Melampsora larici-populina 98AG31]
MSNTEHEGRKDMPGNAARHTQKMTCETSNGSSPIFASHHPVSHLLSFQTFTEFKDLSKRKLRFATEIILTYPQLAHGKKVSRGNTERVSCIAAWVPGDDANLCQSVPEHYQVCVKGNCDTTWATAICNDDKSHPGQEVLCDAGHQFNTQTHKLECDVAKNGSRDHTRYCDRLKDGTAPQCDKEACRVLEENGIGIQNR